MKPSLGSSTAGVSRGQNEVSFPDQNSGKFSALLTLALRGNCRAIEKLRCILVCPCFKVVLLSKEGQIDSRVFSAWGCLIPETAQWKHLPWSRRCTWCFPDMLQTRKASCSSQELCGTDQTGISEVSPVDRAFSGVVGRLFIVLQMSWWKKNQSL